jgi:hypothetical protein
MRPVRYGAWSPNHLNPAMDFSSTFNSLDHAAESEQFRLCSSQRHHRWSHEPAERK